MVMRLSARRAMEGVTVLPAKAVEEKDIVAAIFFCFFGGFGFGLKRELVVFVLREGGALGLNRCWSLSWEIFVSFHWLFHPSRWICNG
jgi:hypothetical protein